MRKSADLQRCFHVPGQPGPSTLSGLNGLNNVLEAGVCIVGRGGCVNRQKKGANVLAAGLLLWPVNVEASKVPTATQPGMRMLSCENLATAWGVQAACAPSMRTNPLAPPVKRQCYLANSIDIVHPCDKDRIPCRHEHLGQKPQSRHACTAHIMEHAYYTAIKASATKALAQVSTSSTRLHRQA